jgi:integrase/recombinase XerC
MLLHDAIKQFGEWRQHSKKAETVKSYGYVLKSFAVYMKNCHIEQITEMDIVGWFSLLRKFEWDGNSLIPRAVALRKFLEYYKKKGAKVLDPWFIQIPSKDIKVPRVATKEDYLKVLSIIPDNNDPRHIRNRALIMMYWDTVARNSEIISLDLDDIEQRPEGGKALIQTAKSKGKRPLRQIYWGKETERCLQKWIQKRKQLMRKVKFGDQDALFVSCCSSRVGHRLKKGAVTEIFRRYSHLANLGYVMNAHSIRHRGCHDIAKQSGAVAVMNIAGHASLASSSIYTMLCGDELEEIHNSIKR